MGSCRGMSSVQRSRYVSWYVDSAESPASATTALTATEAGSGPIPLLLLSPPETSGGETSATFSHQRLQPSFTKRTHQVSVRQSHHSQLNSSSALHNSDSVPHNDSDERGKKRNLRHPEADDWNKEDPSLLHGEDESFLLPRSSPVISRRHRPLSWHGGGNDTSGLDSPSPATGSLSLDQNWHLTVTTLENLQSKSNSYDHSSRLQEDKKPCCISLSSNLDHLLSTGLHLPISGEQGLAEEHRGRGLTSCDAPHSSGLSTSTQDSRERRCSGIPEFSADTFKYSCELEKENAHFIVVDIVLEVLEGVKWTLSFDQRTSTMNSDQNRHYKDEEEEEAGNDEVEHQPKTFSVLSTDSGFEECGADTAPTPRDSLRIAECLAQQLVLEFRRNWLPSHKPRCGRQSLCRSLQELPGTGGVVVSSSSLTEEIRLRTRMRGSLSWAPPRFQIIFTVQPTHRRSEAVALQHFLCAGCGTAVEPKYIKKLRYCEYLGKYFCDCCHSGSEAVIPGRVLSFWDFGRYPVSDFSKQLLDLVWHQPLFDLTCIGKALYNRVKELDKFREIHDQLLGIKKLLTACRLSGRGMTEFEQLPAHLMEKPYLFSMDDLMRVKKGQLVVQARAVLHSAVNHVENCELCLARGFICEFCRERDIIFPFQHGICRRCPVCRACFHKHCFVEKKCPKCARIQSRKQNVQIDP